MTGLALHCISVDRTSSAAAVEIVDATTENGRASSEEDTNSRRPATDLGLNLLARFHTQLPYDAKLSLERRLSSCSACLSNYC